MSLRNLINILKTTPGGEESVKNLIGQNTKIQVDLESSIQACAGGSVSRDQIIVLPIIQFNYNGKQQQQRRQAATTNVTKSTVTAGYGST